jgi:Hydroxymethylglutaryl-CoA reductase
MPMKVGTVGGPLQSNPTVALNLRLLGVTGARGLAEVMGAVGLAQNFSALRALVTEGIQQGHMTLHARSVAMAAGATAEVFETVVERLIETGQIKIWKAQEILVDLRKRERGVIEAAAPEALPRSSGHGKVILLGEHAVVYGSHAIAAPVPLAIQAAIQDVAEGGLQLVIPRWGVEYRVHRDPQMRDSFQQSLGIIFDRLGLSDRSLRIEVFPNVPRARGLGGSAAMAVAITRALDEHFALGLGQRGSQRHRLRVREGGARHALGGRQHARHLRPVPALPPCRRRWPAGADAAAEGAAPAAAGDRHLQQGEPDGAHRGSRARSLAEAPGALRADLPGHRCAHAGRRQGDRGL